MKRRHEYAAAKSKKHRCITYICSTYQHSLLLTTNILRGDLNYETTTEMLPSSSRGVIYAMRFEQSAWRCYRSPPPLFLESNVLTNSRFCDHSLTLLASQPQHRQLLTSLTVILYDGVQTCSSCATFSCCGVHYCISCSA